MDFFFNFLDVEVVDAVSTAVLRRCAQASFSFFDLFQLLVIPQQVEFVALFCVNCIEILVQLHVVVLRMRDDQLLGHFDLDFLLLELSVHLLQDLFERFLVDVDLLVDKVAESDERVVNEALLKQIIFELTAAH